MIPIDRQLHFIILPHFLVPLLRPSFVFRPQPPAVPPEHQLMDYWCQSRSPSWHGTCIDWHRTPAPLWPVAKPLGTLENLYPSLGPNQLLESRKAQFDHWISTHRHFWKAFRSCLHSPIHLSGSIINRIFVSSSSSNNTSCFTLSSLTCCCLLSSIFSLLLKYCRPWERNRIRSAPLPECRCADSVCINCCC